VNANIRIQDTLRTSAILIQCVINAQSWLRVDANPVQLNEQRWNASATKMLALVFVPYRSIWPLTAKSYWQSGNIIFFGDFAAGCEIDETSQEHK